LAISPTEHWVTLADMPVRLKRLLSPLYKQLDISRIILINTQ